METKIDRMVRRVVSSMTQVESEDWGDALKVLVDELQEMDLGLQNGEMMGITRVWKAAQRLEREERNVEDLELRLEVNGLLSEVAKVLNTAEVEKRRFEDEGAKHLSRCRALRVEVRELAGKFEVMEGRQ